VSKLDATGSKSAMRIWNGQQNRGLQEQVYEILTKLPSGEETLCLAYT